MTLDWDKVTAFAAALPGAERVLAMIERAHEQALTRKRPRLRAKTSA